MNKLTSLLIIISLLAVGCNTTNQNLIGESYYSTSSKCVDTDGGIKLDKAGAVYIKGDTNPYGNPDVCMPSGQLLEKFCENENAKANYFDCQEGTICNNGVCVKPKDAFICGNGICENQREINAGCFYDCNLPCSGKYCADNVELRCGCTDEVYKSMKASAPCQAVSCNSCSASQESLYPAFLGMQETVTKCLSDYFNFTPSRILNLVLDNPMKEVCKEKTGCLDDSTGHAFNLGLLWHNLPGKVGYNQKEPQKAENIVVDEHEATHIFTYQMLHNAPKWFMEAISIQTEERLHCHSQEAPEGDAYLLETAVDAVSGLGINLESGLFLNEDFYQKLKTGEATLSSQEEQNGHILGSLWVMGLKLDYKCNEKCISQIMQELQQYVQQQCQISQSACGLGQDYLFGGGGKCSFASGSDGITGKIVQDYSSKPLPKKPVKSWKEDLKKKFQFIQPEPQEYWVVWSPKTDDSGEFIINNKVIKDITTKVIGTDVSPLFNLLKLN